VRRAAHAQGEERRAGDRGGGDRLGAHRRRPGERGRRQPERERRPGRPGVGTSWRPRAAAATKPSASSAATSSSAPLGPATA
jgi:hypothetical protein